MDLFTLIIIVVVTLGIGGAGFYFLWWKSRPKKETYVARVWQLSDATRDSIKDVNGNIISELKLRELKPFMYDILERIEKDPGITIYRLQKLNKPTPEVTGDYVDYWPTLEPEKRKEVNVLMFNGTCTLMRKGFDKKTSDVIFHPMPISRINMLKSEMAIRKDRLMKEKDILQAITPWIIAGICIIGLIGITYILMNGYTEISKKNAETIQYQADKFLEAEQVRHGITPIINPVGRQDATTKPSTNIPVIDK
jgi:hypothetical protein